MRTDRSYIRYIGRVVAVVVTALLLVCMLLGAWAGYIDPAVWVLPSMLCLVFPMLWLLSLAVGLLWLVFSRARVYAIMCGCALLLGLPTMSAVSPLGFPEDMRADETPLTVMTYNVASLKDLELGDNTYSRSLSCILRSDADIVCLQELFSLEAARSSGVPNDAQIDSVNALYPYQVMGEREEEALLSKYPAEYVTGYSALDRNYFNYQLYRIYVAGHKISVLNVHLPSYRLTADQKAIAAHLKEHPGDVLDQEDNVSLYRTLRAAFETRALAARQLKEMADTIPGPLIVCGDFNDVPGSYAWQTMRSAGLADACSEAGKGPMVTFNAGYMFFHIDQIMYRPDEGLRPLEISRGSLKSSDHYPVTVRFALGPGKMK